MGWAESVVTSRNGVPNKCSSLERAARLSLLHWAPRLLFSAARMVAVDPAVAASIAKNAGAGGLRTALPLLKQALDEPIQSSPAYSARGDTLLTLAARSGNSEAVRLLMQEGAEVDARTKYEATPLYIACQENRPAVVKILLDSKASVNNQADGALTPLMVACHQGNTECVSLLCAQKGIKHILDLPSQDHGLTPLLRAAFGGFDGCVRHLVDAGASVSVADQDGATALTLACRNGHAKVVRLLLKAKAEPDRTLSQASGGGAPLHFACKVGSAECVKLLVGAKANPDLPAGDGGCTALHLAAQHGYTECCRLLLEAKASVEAKDRDGVPPMFYADTAGHGATAKLLTSFGASRAHGDDPKTVWGVAGTPGTKAPSAKATGDGEGLFGLW